MPNAISVDPFFKANSAAISNALEFVPSDTNFWQKPITLSKD